MKSLDVCFWKVLVMTLVVLLGSTLDQSRHDIGVMSLLCCLCHDAQTSASVQSMYTGDETLIGVQFLTV